MRLLYRSTSLPYLSSAARCARLGRHLGGMPVDLVEKSCMRKIYIRLLPFAILSYFLAYIDRINVSFAGLTMRGDLDMSAAAFGFASGTFFWGYFLFAVPSNLILEKVGARLWI